MRPADRDEEDPDVGDVHERFSARPNVATLANGPFSADKAEANGSSIAFLAEFGGKRVLLAADAHSAVLETALAPLAQAEGGRYRLDLLKLSHHGSAHNTSPDFFRMIDCTRFAVSTDGTRQHKHPHPPAIARLLAADPTRNKRLYFNYRQPQTEVWDSSNLMTKWKYECIFAAEEAAHQDNGTLKIEI